LAKLFVRYNNESDGTTNAISKLTFKGKSIVDRFTYRNGLIIFDKRITWIIHIETATTKAFRVFIRVYPIFKTERKGPTLN